MDRKQSDAKIYSRVGQRKARCRRTYYDQTDYRIPRKTRSGLRGAGQFHKKELEHTSLASDPALRSGPMCAYDDSGQPCGGRNPVYWHVRSTARTTGLDLRCPHAHTGAPHAVYTACTRPYAEILEATVAKAVGQPPPGLPIRPVVPDKRLDTLAAGPRTITKEDVLRTPQGAAPVTEEVKEKWKQAIENKDWTQVRQHQRPSPCHRARMPRVAAPLLTQKGF